MDIPVNVPGYEGRQLTVHTAGLLSGARVSIDGRAAPKGPRRGEFILQRADGTEDTVTLQGTWLDPVPRLVHNGVTYALAPSFRWYQWVVILLPLCLLAIGGCIGGGLGAATTCANAHILRTNMPEPIRMIAAIALTFGAFVVFIITVVIIALMRGHH